MSRFFHSLRRMFGFGPGDTSPPLASPDQFTHEFAEALRQANPGVQVAIAAPLELRITSEDGRESTSYLDNAYDIYRRDPDAKAKVIQGFVAGWMEAIGGGIRDEVDRQRIVPVIKDRAWLEESRRALAARGAEEVQEFVYEDFDATSHLVIVYAEDSPKNIRFLTPANLDAAKIERAELRRLACDNLQRLLPSIERHGADGLYMLTAGGNYEASLLAIDSLWNSGQMDVHGDIVVAVPSRDLLLVTGSENREGLQRIRAVVQETLSRGSYRLTDELFVYRDGRFEEFQAPDEPGFSLN